MARYNVRDLIGHWVSPAGAGGKMCPHACCRGYRVHPENMPRILPSRLLRRASDDDLAAHYDRSADDPRAEAQVLHELDRRDRLTEERRRHREAVNVARAGRRQEREAEYERIRRDAETATQGYLVNERGRARGTTDREILSGREEVFHRYATEEAVNYFREHPRPTGAHFRGHDTRVSGRYTYRGRGRRPSALGRHLAGTGR